MKMNVRKKAALAVAAAFSLSAFMPTLSAAPLSTGDTVMIADGPGSGPGGEFILTSFATGSFASFCLEKNEFISVPGGPYTVTLNSNAVNGGNGFAGTYLGDVNGAAGADPLSNATAWLYTSYLSGSLAGWGSLSATARADKAQEAIWFLENEAATSNSWVTDAITAVTVGGWTNPSGFGQVYALNLTNGQNLHQDQLYMAPVPEPETYAMLLAGLGLMGFVARRRQRKLASA